MGGGAWILLGLWTLAALGVGLSWWMIQEQTQAAQRLEAALLRVEEAVKEGRWSSARDLLAEVISDWEATRRRWALHVDHGEMDVITDDLREAQALITIRDASALAPLQRARDRIVTLPERDRLNLENLL